ncbi:Uncharacterized protein FWK35_00011112 [Aphis craccivora]|uniref:Uncharacterized protein n=1 Tax=Aphis craccivora TaxID=307492 RepID=A0A6G0YRG6_APHCR|nr:Uncharacterized protein FWK35_00011112 [Aphis craccivora]
MNILYTAIIHGVAPNVLFVSIQYDSECGVFGVFDGNCSGLNGLRFLPAARFFLPPIWVVLDLAVGCVPICLLPINFGFLEFGFMPEYFPNVCIAEERLAWYCGGLFAAISKSFIS